MQKKRKKIKRLCGKKNEWMREYLSSLPLIYLCNVLSHPNNTD